MPADPDIVSDRQLGIKADVLERATSRNELTIA